MMFKVGVVGALIAAICCFTPILVWILAPLGLGAVTMIYIEFGLLAAMFLFTGIAIFALILRSRNEGLKED